MIKVEKKQKIQHAHFTRLETWAMNSEIDSSLAKAPKEWSFDGLASFASDVTASNLAGGVEAALEDPPTPTL